VGSLSVSSLSLVDLDFPLGEVKGRTVGGLSVSSLLLVDLDESPFTLLLGELKGRTRGA
jgi:hypothetical protein